MTLICYFKRNDLWCFSGFIIFLLHRGNATSIALVPPERNLGDKPRPPSSSYVFLKFISLFLSAMAPSQSVPKLSLAWATINRLLSWGLLYWDAVWSRNARVSSRGGNPSVTFRIPSKRPPNDLWGPVLSGPVPSGISSCPSLSLSLCPCHTGCLSVPPAGHSFWLRACAHALPSTWRAYLPLLPSGLTSIQFSHWTLKVNLLINTPPHTKSYISLCYILLHNVLLFDVAVCLTALTTKN